MMDPRTAVTATAADIVTDLVEIMGQIAVLIPITDAIINKKWGCIVTFA
jgi:hypothetical protein